MAAETVQRKGGGEKVLGATQDTLKAFRANEQIKFDMRCPATLSLSLSPTLPFLPSAFFFSLQSGRLGAL